MQPVKTYDPKAYSCILGGHIAEGFADGTFIRVERNNDTWQTKVGADGEGARAKSNDKSTRVTLTLMQTSLTNSYLSGLAKADELNNGGVIPFLLKDGNGDTVVEALTIWAVKPATIELGKEITNREWILETNDADIFVGSNS